MKNLYFLSFNDGKIDGGATVRIRGILNALAEKKFNVYFFSNVNDYHNYHSSITHIPLPFHVSRFEKMLIQGLMANVDYKVVNLFFNNWYKELKALFSQYSIDTLISFEYLDNTIAYWLWKNNFINKYANDIHGVADLEFKKGFEIAPIYKKPIYLLKYNSSQKLDKKVIGNAVFNIFPSEKMKNYFFNLITNLTESNSIIIPNLINPDNYKICKDLSFVQSLKPLNNINLQKKKLLFVGSFKKTSGVLQLIKIAKNLKNDVELIMVGDGPLFQPCKDLIRKEEISNVHLLGRQPYEHLNCFHNFTDIMVCPDEDNPFSQMIIHLKYFDALMSNKPVINADFTSVEEINVNNSLSVSYTASNFKELESKLKSIIDNYHFYQQKYNKNRQYVSEKLSYDNYINILINQL